MSLSMETEKENKFIFLDIEIIRKRGEFIVNLYSVVYTLFYRGFCIFAFAKIGTKIHIELTFFKRILVKMVFLKSLLTSFKMFPDNIHLVKENIPTLQIRRLLLVLPYLGRISLQSRTKL